jgi:hypothetical protein
MPDLTQLVGDDAEVSSRPRIPMWLALVLMAIALVLALVILARIGGPLSGLLFPSGVPIPDGADEIDHVKPEKGAEYWIYGTDDSGRDVAAFYEDEGGICRYTATGLSEPAPEGSHSVARCLAKSDGAESSWEVFIAEGYSEEDGGPTIFRVYKYETVN